MLWPGVVVNAVTTVVGVAAVDGEIVMVAIVVVVVVRVSYYYRSIYRRFVYVVLLSKDKDVYMTALIEN